MQPHLPGSMPSFYKPGNPDQVFSVSVNDNPIADTRRSSRPTTLRPPPHDKQRIMRHGVNSSLADLGCKFFSRPPQEWLMTIFPVGGNDRVQNFPTNNASPPGKIHGPRLISHIPEFIGNHHPITSWTIHIAHSFSKNKNDPWIKESGNTPIEKEQAPCLELVILTNCFY